MRYTLYILPKVPSFQARQLKGQIWLSGLGVTTPQAEWLAYKSVKLTILHHIRHTNADFSKNLAVTWHLKVMTITLYVYSAWNQYPDHWTLKFRSCSIFAWLGRLVINFVVYYFQYLVTSKILGIKCRIIDKMIEKLSLISFCQGTFTYAFL